MAHLSGQFGYVEFLGDDELQGNFEIEGDLELREENQVFRLFDILGIKMHKPRMYYTVIEAEVMNKYNDFETEIITGVLELYNDFPTDFDVGLAYLSEQFGYIEFLSNEELQGDFEIESDFELKEEIEVFRLFDALGINTHKPRMYYAPLEVGVDRYSNFEFISIVDVLNKVLDFDTEYKVGILNVYTDFDTEYEIAVLNKYTDYPMLILVPVKGMLLFRGRIFSQEIDGTL